MNDDDYDSDLYRSDRLGEILLIIVVIIIVFLPSCWPSQATVNARSMEYSDRTKVSYGANVREGRVIRYWFFLPIPPAAIRPWYLIDPYPLYLRK